MEELLNSPEFQEIQKNIPYLIAVSVVQIVLWLLLANSIRLVLKQIKKENRCLHIGQVWFLALPVFNIYWNFVVVRRLVDSLNNEYFDRKLAVEENPTQKQGYLFTLSFAIGNFPLPFFINAVISIVYLVALIMYWIKVVEHNKLLKTSNDVLEKENF